MRTIHIAGGRSGVGKTLLIELAIRLLPDWGAVKVSFHPDARHGPPALITDAAVLDRAGSDTARVRRAGARRVAWMRATAASLPGLLDEADAVCRDLPGVLVEGAGWWRARRDGPLCVLLPPDVADLKAGYAATIADADAVAVTGPTAAAVEPGILDLAGPRAIRADLGDPDDPGRARLLDRLVTWSRR